MSERIWKGNEKLEPLLVPVEFLITHPRNPRRGDLPLLAESLDTFGQTRPIVAQKQLSRPDWIVAGNHTYRAALEVLGWSHIAAVFPVLEEHEYEQYLLMDNRASDASEYDEEVLIPILQKLRETGSFEHTGWDDDQAEDYINSASRVGDRADHEFRKGRDEDVDAEDRGGTLFKKSTKTQNQLMLAYANADYQELVRAIGVLRREYGTEGIGNTIARAAREQFETVFQP